MIDQLAAWRVFLGFGGAIFFGHLVVQPAVRLMWRYLRETGGQMHYPHSSQSGSLSMPLGMLERAICTLALVVGPWQMVGAWLVLKTAAKWKEVDHVRGAGNVWLIGSGLSLLAAYFGAWIVLGHVPAIR